MPGIYGFASGPGLRDASARLEAMAEGLRHHPWYAEDRHVDADAGLALGRTTLGVVDPAEQPATNEDGRLLACLGGEVLDYDAHRAALEAAGHRFRGGSHAELILHGFEQSGPAFFRDLHGGFAAAIWDAPRRRLVLVGDRFGMRPLYYARLDGELLFAAEIKALQTDPRVSRKLNPAGIAQFFTFGQLLGDDTFFDAVRVLPAAGWLEYDAKSDRLTLDRYARFPAPAAETASDPHDHLERIDAAFSASMARCTGGAGGLGISLSGGLDARTILALVDQERTPLTSVCLGIDGSLDHRCAEQMAAQVGCRHHRHVLDHRFLDRFEDHLQTMVRLTDGHYLCQCIVMPTLPVYRELAIEVLLRGHAGELMHMGKAYNYSMGRDALALRDGAAVEGWLHEHLQAFILDWEGTAVFAPALRGEVEGLARESFRAALRDTEDTDPPVHRIWQVFVEQRLRRETALSMTEFHSVVETRLPYLDAELIAALMAAPPDLKLDETIQAHILRKHRPGFLAIPNANIGAPLDAGPVAKKLAYYKLRVLSKLRVKGYEPYERLGLWLRRELRPLVAKLLLEGDGLDTDLFDPAGVRAAVEDHWEGRHNRTYLILALMIFAERQRQLRESRPMAEAAH